MNEYAPDRWMLVHLKINGGKEHFRIFGTWSGGYMGADNWKLNSGIEEIHETEDYFDVVGHSGSVYRCYKSSYGSNAYGVGVLLQYEKKYGKDKFIVFWEEPENLSEFMKTTIGK